MNSNEKKSNISNIKDVTIIFCIVLFAGIIRIPSLTQPLGPDQGIMSVIGEGILNGELPYRDYWEMASPAIFYTYALMFKIFGLSMAAIPITDILINMITTFLIFLFARAIWDQKTGYISSLVYAFFSSGVRLGMHSAGDIAFGTFWYVAQRETFILPLVILSFYLIIGVQREEGKLLRLIFAGFLAGLTFVYKFPALLFFVSILIYINGNYISLKDKFHMKQFFRNNLALITGFILASIPFTLIFIINGAVDEMIEIIFKYVNSVYGQIEYNVQGLISKGLKYTFFLVKENFILWIFWMISSIYIIINERLKENLFVVVWGLISLVYVISHREFLGYHYLVVLPPFSMLTGYGLVKALGRNLSWRKLFTEEIIKSSIILTVLINIFFFVTLNHMYYMKFFFYMTGKLTKEQYYDFFTAYPKHDYSFSADYQVAQYLKNNTNADDLIFVLGGIESVIHFLTKRKSPSRFVFSWIIYSYEHSRVKMAEVYRKEVLTDLKSEKPKYIITVRSLENFQEHTEVYNFIKDNYVLEKTFSDDRYVYLYHEYEEDVI